LLCCLPATSKLVSIALGHMVFLFDHNVVLAYTTSMAEEVTFLLITPNRIDF